MRRVRMLISGRVQGVFFRANTVDHARKYQVTGWVKNLSDGRVEVIAEGEDNNVDNLVQYCRQGPQNAKVEHIQIDNQKFTGEFTAFNLY